MIIEGFQLSQCRGLEEMVLDNSSEIAVVKAQVARVSNAMVQLNPQAQLCADALEQFIPAKERGMILFQLKEFDWTILWGYRKGIRFRELLPQLSDILQTRAMTLTITDTAPYIYHQVWDDGESVEHFLYKDCYVDENDYIGESKVVRLESQIRQVSESDVEHNALDNFYAEQGVYFPDLKITLEPLKQDGKSTFMFKVSGEFSWCLSKQLKHLDRKDYTRTYQLERSNFEGFDYIIFED